MSTFTLNSPAGDKTTSSNQIPMGAPIQENPPCAVGQPSMTNSSPGLGGPAARGPQPEFCAQLGEWCYTWGWFSITCFISVTLGRCVKIVTHFLWLMWAGYIHTGFKILLVFFRPRISIDWSFWRKAFCMLWIQTIRNEVIDAVDSDSENLQLYKDGSEGVFHLVEEVVMKGHVDVRKDVDSTNRRGIRVLRMGRAFNNAAEKFRARVTSELNTLQIVSALLLTMNFAAIVLNGDLFQPGRSSSETNNNAPAPGDGWPLKDFPEWTRQAFVVCCFMSLIFSILMTGVFARLSSVLNWCPERHAMVWFLFRFEPTMALMHILFPISLILTTLTALFAVWGTWFVAMNSDTIRNTILAFAAVSIIYFLYNYASGFYCPNHGLVGIIEKNIYFQWRDDKKRCCIYERIKGEYIEKYTVNDGHMMYWFCWELEMRAILEHEFFRILSQEPFCAVRRNYTKEYDNLDSYRDLQCRNEDCTADRDGKGKCFALGKYHDVSDRYAQYTSINAFDCPPQYKVANYNEWGPWRDLVNAVCCNCFSKRDSGYNSNDRDKSIGCGCCLDNVEVIPYYDFS